MPIKQAIQEAMKQAMRDKDQQRLATLRLAKGALLLREKEQAAGTEISDADAVQALRSEIKKRQQTIELLEQNGKTGEIATTRAEIAVLEAFLPQQLAPEEVEARVRAYLAEHPEVNHAGKLTGAMKQVLGDQVDGKTLNQVCRRVLEG